MYNEKKIHEQSLALARQLIEKDPSLRDWVVSKFPELAENEDKRIRKEIIEYLQRYLPTDELLKEQEMVAWLEKQKEHHIPWYDYQKSKEAGYTIVPNEEYEQLIKQKEQKPAWSEEDSVILDCAVEVVEKAGLPSLAASLKSLRPCPSWKPSEEQMRALDKAIPVCMGIAGKDECSPLISLYEQLKKL